MEGQPARSVVAHVSRTRLYAAHSDEDELYARMIDGRTIHQYILFIEPILRAANPLRVRDVLPVLGADQFAATPQRFFVLADPPTDNQPCLRDGRFVPVPIQRQTGDRSELDRIAAAIALIDEVCMGFFIDLGARFVVLDTRRHQVGWVQGEDVVVQDALLLLEQAARGFITLWARAEHGPAAALEAYPSVVLTPDLQEIFSASVLAEFLVRLGRHTAAALASDDLRQRHFSIYSMETVLNRFPAFALTSELVAYWLPLWNRAAVIFDSPFDTMSELLPAASAGQCEL